MKEILIEVISHAETLWANNTKNNQLICGENLFPSELDTPEELGTSRFSSVDLKDFEFNVDELRILLNEAQEVWAKHNRFYKFSVSSSRVMIELEYSWGPIQIDNLISRVFKNSESEAHKGELLDAMADLILKPEMFDKYHEKSAPGALTFEIMRQHFLFNRSAMHRRVSKPLKPYLDKVFDELCDMGVLRLVSAHQIEKGLQGILNNPEIRFGSKARFYTFACFEKCGQIATKKDAKNFYNSYVQQQLPENV